MRHRLAKGGAPSAADRLKSHSTSLSVVATRLRRLLNSLNARVALRSVSPPPPFFRSSRTRVVPSLFAFRAVPSASSAFSAPTRANPARRFPLSRKDSSSRVHGTRAGNVPRAKPVYFRIIPFHRSFFFSFLRQLDSLSELGNQVRVHYRYSIYTCVCLRV